MGHEINEFLTVKLEDIHSDDLKLMSCVIKEELRAREVRKKQEIVDKFFMAISELREELKIFPYVNYTDSNGEEAKIYIDTHNVYFE